MSDFPALPEALAASAGRRVLVVEDEFLAALTMTDFLESIGCEVVGPAARLSIALELARSESIDVAVLDINIAGEMVWPVAEELGRRKVPFVFLTAYAKADVLPLGFADAPCLAKPLMQQRLLGVFHAIWGNSAKGMPTS